MIAPPGKPKMVETPSSTSDWHIARAPFKRICCTSFKQKSPPLYRGGVTSRGTTLFVCSRRCYRPPPRPGLLPCKRGVLPDGSEASSGTCLHRSCTMRRLSAAARQFRTTPRQRLDTYSTVAPNHTLLTPQGSSQ